MNNFKEVGFKKGGKDFGGRPKFGGGASSRGRRPGASFGGGDRNGRSQGRPELFAATCSSCHKSCEVPFRPSGDKPVYCSACFGHKSSDDSRGERDRERSEFRPRNDARSVNSDYGKPERDFHPAHTDTARTAEDNNLKDVVRQLATIESHLKRIVDFMNQSVPVLKAVEHEVISLEVLPQKEKKPKTVKARHAVKKVVKKAKK